MPTPRPQPRAALPSPLPAYQPLLPRHTRKVGTNLQSAQKLSCAMLLTSSWLTMSIKVFLHTVGMNFMPMK